MSASIQEFLTGVAAIELACLPSLQRLVECPECEGARVDADRNCFTCEGTGEVTPEVATAYHESYAESLPPCECCGEPSDDLQEVEDRDDETGYYARSEICGDCRRAPLRREAEEAGGLAPYALDLLGVDEEWMYEGSRLDICQEDLPVPSKPPARETQPIPAGERDEPRFGIGGAR